MADKRDGRRRPRRLSVRFGEQAPDQLAFASNVSAQGLFLQTKNSYPRGTVLQLEVVLPSGSARLVARVSWIRRFPPKLAQGLQGGLGLEVIGCQPAWPQAIADWEAGCQEPTSRFATPLVLHD